MNIVIQSSEILFHLRDKADRLQVEFFLGILMSCIGVLRVEKDRTGWCSGNALDLFPGSAQFESRPKHQPSWQILREFPHFLLGNASSSSTRWRWLLSKYLPVRHSPVVVPSTLYPTNPCSPPVCFTPFCFNTPCQFTPLVNLRSFSV
jgi:hypothetical protein